MHDVDKTLTGMIKYMTTLCEVNEEISLGITKSTK